jgi:hypothetical protein
MPVTATPAIQRHSFTPFARSQLATTVTDVLLDSSYVTGGEPLTAADLGLTRVAFAFATVKQAGAGGSRRRSSGVLRHPERQVEGVQRYW